MQSDAAGHLEHPAMPAACSVAGSERQWTAAVAWRQLYRLGERGSAIILIATNALGR